MKNAPTNKITLMIINFAMMMVLVILGFVLFIITNQTPSEDANLDVSGMFMIFVALGMMAIPMSILALFAPIVFGFWRANPIQHNSLPDKIFFNFDDSKLFQKMVPLTIMRFAFSEAVAILGFVIAMLSRNALLYAPFFVLATTLMFLVGPFLHALRKRSSSDVVDYTNFNT